MLFVAQMDGVTDTKHDRTHPRTICLLDEEGTDPKHDPTRNIEK